MFCNTIILCQGNLPAHRINSGIMCLLEVVYQDDIIHTGNAIGSGSVVIVTHNQ